MSSSRDPAIPLPRAWSADQAPVGLVALGRNGHVLYANRAAARILGGEGPPALLGRDARDFHPVPDVALATVHDHLEEEGIRGLEVTLRRLDGDPVDVRIAADILEPGPAGARVVAVLEDVGSARARAEGEFQGRTMAAVGRLAGGMAHHFNNLLGSIRANATLVQAALRDGGDPADELRQISRAAERASEIADLLLIVSGQEVGRRSVVNAASWVYGAAGALREGLPADVELSVQADAGGLPVHADPDRMGQALHHLVANAEEAVSAGGRILVEARALTLTGAGDEPAFVPPALPGRYAAVTVTDDGLGMNADTLARAMEPFFSTRRDREGAGLGLPLVYGMVSQMGGHLRVESQPLEGTRAWMLFPLAGAPHPGVHRLLEDTGLHVGAPSPPSTGDESGQGRDPAPGRPSGAGSSYGAGPPSGAAAPRTPEAAGAGPAYDLVLLVDDEESIRRVMEKILVRAGYRVVSAVNGRDAQRVFRAHESELALLVTDIMMPELNGIDLARWARERVPDLPVLLVSGFADSALVQAWLEREPESFLAKPFEPADLLGWVSRRVPLSVS